MPHESFTAVATSLRWRAAKLPSARNGGACCRPLSPSVELVDTDRKPDPQSAGDVGQGVVAGAYDDGLVEQPGVELGGVVSHGRSPHPVR